jgi:hypothetical protein
MRMRKNEEIVDRINSKYHWAETNNEENLKEKQRKRAIEAKKRKDKKIKERQERHSALVKQVRD